MVRDLFVLFITFCKIGAVTFGGGMAMLPILERELADKRKWTTSEELLDYYAISQSTPGIIAVNVATFIGFKKRKVAGGIAATLGVVTPSVIIISLIAAFISNFEQIAWVQKALRGINVAVAALLLYSVIGLARKAIKKPWQLLFFALSFSLIYFFKVHSVFIIFGAAVCGVLIAWLAGSLRAAPAAGTDAGNDGVAAMPSAAPSGRDGEAAE